MSGPRYQIEAGFFDSFSSGPFVLEHEGRSWRFEFSEQFGPSLVDDQGEILSRQPTSPHHPFFGPFHQWLWQGQQLDGDRCVFCSEMTGRPNIVRHVGGFDYELVRKGGHEESPVILIDDSNADRFPFFRKRRP